MDIAANLGQMTKRMVINLERAGGVTVDAPFGAYSPRATSFPVGRRMRKIAMPSAAKGGGTKITVALAPVF